MADIGTDWRMLNGVATAWFDAPSLVEGAALAGRAVDLSSDIAVDVRTSGVRVRLHSPAHGEAVSSVASELGLTANPGVLQQLDVVVESAEPTAVQDFWQRVLGYSPDLDGGLVDPLRRNPTMRIRPSTDSRPLRNRIHLDVVRPAAEVERANLGEASGPFGVRHLDPDDNEVDVVPADALGDAVGTSDWQAVFGAVACYRTTSDAQQRELATVATALANEVGFPLLIDLRPGLVIIDSAKDQWEPDAHGLDVDFIDLAERIQSAARELGAKADTALPRFVQLFLDAADVAAARAFWVAALGYRTDRRGGCSDIYDPRRLNPELVFQAIDTTETERRKQRNRIHFELAVPTDVAHARVAQVVAAGGRLTEESKHRWQIADPEGNDLIVVSGA